MEIRTVSVVVLPESEPIFSDMGTTISVVDEAGGEFIEISQNTCAGKIRIDPGEWPFIRNAIDNLAKKCRS